MTKTSQRGLKELPGVGTVAAERGRRGAVLTVADGRVLEARRRHPYRWAVTVLDGRGSEVGGYRQRRRLVAGGPLTLAAQEYAQEYTVVAHSSWLVDLALEAGGRELARAGAANTRPTRVRVADPAALDPAVLLLFVWLADEYGSVGNGLMRLWPY